MRLSDEQIKHGLRKAERFTGFMKLGVFLEMCEVTAEDLGLPDAHSAYLEACNAPAYGKDRHAWSHPAVFHAGKETGWFELSALTEEQCFPRFRHAYEQIIKRVRAGEPLDLPVPQALPETVSRLCTIEENRANLRQLRERVGL